MLFFGSSAFMGGKALLRMNRKQVVYIMLIAILMLRIVRQAEAGKRQKRLAMHKKKKSENAFSLESTIFALQCTNI